ncbi:MAG: hypothetical protein ACOYVK_15175 [Bacillota bacterium]
MDAILIDIELDHKVGDLMNSTVIRHKFKTKLMTSSDISFDSAEEFYYILGQFLVYVFQLLGGADKYKKEFNFLTNPYLPLGIQDICTRIIAFLKRLPHDVLYQNSGTIEVYEAFIFHEISYTKNPINQNTCTQAFYQGIHEENVFTSTIDIFRE